MIVSYEVGAVYRIVDEASPVLRRLADQMEMLDRVATSLRTKLLEIADVRFTGMTRSVQSLEKNLTAAGVAADRMGGQVAGGVALITGGLARANAEAAGLATQMRAIAAASRNLGRSGFGGGGAAAGGAAAGGAGGGGRHGPGGGVHTRFGGGIPVAGGHAHASVTGAGSGGMVAGGVAAFGIYEAMKASMDPLHQRVLYEQLGASPEETKQAVAKSWDIARTVPGTRAGGNLALIADARSIVGAEHAMEMAPGLARTEQVLNNLSDKGGKKGSMLDLLRSGELTGAFTDDKRHLDIEKFNRFLDFATKTAEATHGKVMPSDLLALAKQGAPTLGSLDETGWQSMAVMTQAMGGNRAGTAMTALQRQFLGGKMTQSTLAALEEMGIADPKDFEVRRGGKVVPKTGAMHELVDKFIHDPFSAFTDIITPALQKKGVVTPEQFAPWNFKLFGTNTSQRAAFELFRGGEQFTGERTRLGQALGVQGASDKMNAKDPEQAVRSFTSAFTNLLGAFGSPLMESAIPKITALAAAMNSLGGWFQSHPKTAVAAGSGIGGAGAGALIGGVGGFFLGGPGGAAAGAFAGMRIGAALGLGYGAMTSADIGAHELGGLPSISSPRTAPGATTAESPMPGLDSMLVGKGGGLDRLADTINITAPPGTTEDQARAIMESLARQLSQAGQHNLDQGAGNLSSPWTGGQ